MAILAAGAASAQGYYNGPSYPPPAYPPGYVDQPAPEGGVNRADQDRSYPAYPPQDPRYQDPRYQDPRYQDPRYADPRYRAWLNRYYPQYYGQGYSQRYVPAYPEPPAAPGQNAYPPAPPTQPPAVERTAAPPPPARAETPTAAEAALAAPHLPHRLIEAAQAYAGYIKKASSIDAGFKSAEGVAAAVRVGSAYEAHQFQEGAIAYAALTALQEPGFIAGARQVLREGDHGADFAAELAANPQAALNIAGADLAAARAATALRRHGANLVNAGAGVKAAAYTVQLATWSKAQVSDPDARLAAAKTTSAKRVALEGDEAPELTRAVLSETPGDGQAPSSPVVTRALAIAALAAMGQLQSDDDPHLAALLAEPKSADCLKMAKLNLFQCLAVARPHYEDIFCLGEHAMMETGQCVVKAAGFTPVPVTLARANVSATSRR